MEFFRARLVGVTPEDGRKLLFTIVFVLIVVLLGRLLGWITGRVLPSKRLERAGFWTRQEK